jgi:hypothetical protein
MLFSIMHSKLFAIVTLAISAILASCSTGNSTTPTTESIEMVPTSVPRPIMPDVVCLNLQEAQDLIQDQGVFYSRSKDASGLGRNQIVDSNWVVIEQNLKPGEPFSEGDALLGVIKAEEAEVQGLC